MKRLNDPISKVKHIGKKRQKELNYLGIHTIWDLLTYFPFRYTDYQVQDISKIHDGDKVTLKGTIVTPPILHKFGYKHYRLYFRMITHGVDYWVNIFNQPWLTHKLREGQTIIAYGTFKSKRYDFNVSKLLNSNKAKQVKAVYPTGHNIHQSTIIKSVADAYQQYHTLIHDYIPKKIMKKYCLEPEDKAIHDMHFPGNSHDEKLARRTIKFNEFFLYQMRIQIARKSNQRNRGAQIDYDHEKVGAFLLSLPFQLTHAQKRATKQILADLTYPIEMNRLLQGDVGSGKTVVAAIAIYAAVTAGYQTAIMVPTSVLAEQHTNNLSKIFKGFGVHIGLLTSDMRTKPKRDMIKKIKNGSVNLIIGTNALIQKDIQYKDLGLAIIDEQHRFGVNQRRALRMKGDHPNMLGMTATPIPRTLAITTYGDMDKSIIDQQPKGRKSVKTYWIHTKQVSHWMPGFYRLMKSGQQIYVVAPLIKQPKGGSPLIDADSVYQKFNYYFGKEFGVGFLNGRMDNKQKNDVMTKFKNGTYKMLVSTTVIEVGVDVSSASLMMIFNADHFGLAQLHQLRGRVGRGNQQAFCLLIADPRTQNGKKRMRVMTTTDNGFLISQADLELRGSGDVFGQAQSGVPKFRVADPINDYVILSYAQQDAINIVNEPGWSQYPDNQMLIYQLKLTRKSSIFD